VVSRATATRSSFSFATFQDASSASECAKAHSTPRAQVTFITLTTPLVAGAAELPAWSQIFRSFADKYRGGGRMNVATAAVEAAMAFSKADIGAAAVSGPDELGGDVETRARFCTRHQQI